MTPIQSHGLKLQDLNASRGIEKLKNHSSIKKDDKTQLHKAANEFEVLFLQQVMKSMRDANFKSGLIRKSEGEKIFQSMLDEQYARVSTQSGGLGLSEMIYQQYQSNLKK